MTDKTCAECIDEKFQNEMETLRILWAGFCNDECPTCEGTGKHCNCDEDNCPDADKVCPTCNGDGNVPEDTPEYGSLFEHGLSFDYCYPTSNEDGYFRYQLSWGGPSDEFRIYANKIDDYRWIVYKVEYWFMDWFDGAHKLLTGEDKKFMSTLIEEFFGSCGTMTSVYDKAMEDYEPDEEDFEEEEEE